MRLHWIFQLGARWRHALKPGAPGKAMACSLDGESLTSRLQRINNLGQRHLRSQYQDGLTLRLQYASEAAADLEEIVKQERECCAFLDFDLKSQPTHIELVITSPAEARSAASMLYSYFRGAAPSSDKRSCTGSGCGCTV